MSANKVAIRYARAFVDALQEKGRMDDHKAFLSFLSVVEKSPELEGVLYSVAIKPANKVNVIKAVSEKLNLPDLVVRFLVVLAENRRLNVLPHTGNAVTELIHERLNIRAVELTTASALNNEELEQFSKAFEKTLDAKVQVQTMVDPDIIGGAIARVGSLVYDGSVRGQLARLRRQLVKES